MEDKEKKKKDKKSSNSDRVTLKKEIGLLSACAIIIGECVTVCVLNVPGERPVAAGSRTNYRDMTGVQLLLVKVTMAYGIQ